MREIILNIYFFFIVVKNCLRNRTSRIYNAIIRSFVNFVTIAFENYIAIKIDNIDLKD